MDSPKARPHDALTAVRDLGPLLAAHGEEIERQRELPPAVVEALLQRDLFRLLVPREIGGAEVCPLTLIEVIEAVSMHDASTAWCIGQNAVSGMLAVFLDPDPAREVFGVPTGIVAWGPPSSGEARTVDGGYLLTGKFNFASGSRHAPWLGAHVPVVDRDGSTRKDAGGTPVVHTLLFPKAEAQVTDTWHVMGLKGTGSDSYAVNNVFVPSRFAVRRDAETKPWSSGTLYCFGPSSLYAASFAGVALGIARSALDAFIETARDKVPRGAKRALRDHNFIQFQVGHAEARLRSARAFLMGAYDQAWRHAASGSAIGTEQNIALRLATTWAIREASAVVAAIYDAAGATAIFTSNPFERRFRDIHTVTQQIQGHRANFEAVGQVLLGTHPERRMFTF